MEIGPNRQDEIINVVEAAFNNYWRKIQKLGNSHSEVSGLVKLTGLSGRQ